jgi:hypothetical protein
MNRLRQIAVFTVIAVIAVIATCIGFLAARSESKTESKADTKVEDNFKVSCSKTSLRTTRVSDGQVQEVSERLRLSCEVEILDPNFVLGISRAPVIEEATDDKGENIQVDSRLPSSFRMRHRAPSTLPRFVAPQKPAKWKTAVRSALKLSPKKKSPFPQIVHEVRPSRMQIDLVVGRGRQSSERIGRVKGYFYALVAESFEYVDVPFKKSDKWVRLTPDVEVQVRDAFCDGSSYRLSTKARPEGRGFRGWLSAESYMPARVVVSRQLIGPHDKPVRRYAGPRRLPPYSPGRNSSGSSSMGQIKKIRYVIAVNPTHYKIPFVLENIPLPKP